MKDIRSVVDCMVRRIRNIVAVLAIALISLLGGGKAMAQEYLYPFQSVEHGSRKISMELGAGVGALYTGIGRISSSDVTLASHLGFVGHFDMGVVIGRYFAIESEIVYQKVRFDATYRGHRKPHEKAKKAFGEDTYTNKSKMRKSITHFS